MAFTPPTYVLPETIETLKGVVAELRAEVFAVRERVGAAEGWRSSLKGEMNTLRAEATALRELLEQHQDKFAPAVVDAILKGFAIATARNVGNAKEKQK